MRNFISSTAGSVCPPSLFPVNTLITLSGKEGQNQYYLSDKVKSTADYRHGKHQYFGNKLIKNIHKNLIRSTVQINMIFFKLNNKYVRI